MMKFWGLTIAFSGISSRNSRCRASSFSSSAATSSSPTSSSRDVRFQQLLLEQIQIAVLELHLVDEIDDSRPDPGRVVFRNSNGPGDGVGRLETDAADALDQQVGAVLGNLQRLRTELPVNLEDRLGTDAERGELHGQLTDDSGFADRAADAFDHRFPDARNGQDLFRRILQNGEGHGAELIDDFLGRFPPHPLDPSGREIFDDAFAVLRHDGLETGHLELLPEAGMEDILSLDLQEIALPDVKEIADDDLVLPGAGNQHLEDAEPRLRRREDLFADLDREFQTDQSPGGGAMSTSSATVAPGRSPFISEVHIPSKGSLYKKKGDNQGGWETGLL